jgi:signal peptide peptidase SppA
MPMPLKGKHQSRRLVARVTGTPWMIDHPTLESIVEVLELRTQGLGFTDEELRSRLNRDDDDEEDARAPRRNKSVAILPLQGVTAPRMNMFMQISGGTSTQQFSKWFSQALDDDKVSAIVLDIDSPGGSAIGNEELAQQIRDARGKKPIVAVVTGMMASAAYYIGSAADEIVASPSSEVGSIGTYMIHGESYRADEAEGYEFTVIKGGDNKAVGNSAETLTSQGRAVLQERINALYDQFVGAVASNRRVTKQTVLDRFGQGKVMLAHVAQQAGLIDRIGTLDQVVGELVAKAPSSGKSTQGIRADDAGSAPVVSAATTKEGDVNPELKAALVKAGLISAEASDETAKAVLAAYCQGKGLNADDAKAVIAALDTKAAPPATPASGGGTSTPESAVQAQREKDQRAKERVRIQELSARAELLGVSAEQLQEAVDQEWSVPRAADEWTRQLAKDRTPVGRREVRGGDASEDKLAKAALAVMGDRLGLPSTDADAASYSPALRHANTLEIAKACLKSYGFRVDDMDKEQIANAAIRGVGQGADLTLIPRATQTGSGKSEIRYTTVETAPLADGGAAGGGYNRPADFPYLMSNLMGRMLRPALDDQETTYREWTYRLASLPDFRPKTIIEIGGFGQLPLHIDGDDFEGTPSPAEAANFIQADSYGDEWSMTPRMILDDDLDGLSRVVSEKIRSHERTINQLCINLLTGNPTMPDGTALFHANHTNLVDTGQGGVPAQAQFKKLRLNFRKQTAVNSAVKLNQRLWGILIPEDLEEDAERALANLPVYPDSKTDVETFRGKVKWIVDAMLGSVSAAVWYAFANPQSAQSICYAHQQGYDSLRVRTYFNPTNNCRVNQFEGRFAAIARTHRGVQKNVGA